MVPTMWQTSSTEAQMGERRGRDRRQRSSFRLRERRTGFERRAHGRGGLRGAYVVVLARLRDEPLLLAALLFAINLLNLADLLLTVAALKEGAAEANPVLRLLFASGPWPAAAFKGGVAMAVTLLIWSGRRFRGLIEAALLAVVVLALVVTYQIWGLLAY